MENFTRAVVTLLFVVLSTFHTFAETLPISDNRYLIEADLIGFDSNMLRLARNEIFARKGYAFTSSDLKRHFSQFSWYQPYTKSVSLSSIEQYNVDFIKRYENSPALQSRLQQVIINQIIRTDSASQVANNALEIGVLRREYEDLENKIRTLNAVISYIHLKAEPGANLALAHIITIDHMETMRENMLLKSYELSASLESKYQTPIRPNNSNLGISARARSLSFPRVPYYIAGTSEVGEMWFKPQVSDSGILEFELKFISLDGTNEPVEEFGLSSDEANVLSYGLQKTFIWSEQAQDSGIRRRFEKTAACTPNDQCLNIKVGNTSTQVNFLIFDDGSTAAKLIRNKGNYRQEFSYSIESALLLSAYFDFVVSSSESEFRIQTMDDEDVDALFN